MQQLVLPIDEFLAHAMELALWAPWWGIDWGYSWSSELMGYPRAAGKSYYEEVLGQWKDELDDEQGKFIRGYDLARYRALNSTKPWTQLLLPLMAGYKREQRVPIIRGRTYHLVAVDDAANFR